jgi:hypothetical protein
MYKPGRRERKRATWCTSKLNPQPSLPAATRRGRRPSDSNPSCRYPSHCGSTGIIGTSRVRDRQDSPPSPCGVALHGAGRQRWLTCRSSHQHSIDADRVTRPKDRLVGRSPQWLPAGLRRPQWYARRIMASRVQRCTRQESRMRMMYSRPPTCSSVCHPCTFTGALPTVYTTGRSVRAGGVPETVTGQRRRMGGGQRSAA